MKFPARSTKCQAVVTDLILGIVIFVAVLIVFLNAEKNIQQVDERELDDLVLEASLIADSLLSEGQPRDWTNVTVTEIGIAENNRINETKLSRLQTIPYNQTRNLFRTKYDYYFYFEDKSGPHWILPGVREGIGKGGVNSTSLLAVEAPEKLVSVTRFVIYQGIVNRMIVDVWK